MNQLRVQMQQDWSLRNNYLQFAMNQDMNWYYDYYYRNNLSRRVDLALRLISIGIDMIYGGTGDLTHTIGGDMIGINHIIIILIIIILIIGEFLHLKKILTIRGKMT